MNPNKSHDERQVYRPRPNDEQNEPMSKEKPGFHYVKHHGYAHEDFAEQGKVTHFNGIRVVDESESGESEEFDDFDKLHSSHWTVNYASSARLSDGTILYEGHQ
ncbi:hypothetical protein [Halobellus rubicundus]|uniref:Transposase n=1 Tax=Halobellus rubicundus TaxID=2996466 RepID=A0ABD5MBA1_9EURY